MKTTHITKVVAVVLTVVMLVGMIPTTVLPVFASNAGENNTLASIFDKVVLGKDTVNNTKEYLAAPGFVNQTVWNTRVDPSFSPYEPYSTDNEEHPFLPGGSAWIDLSKIYYGAPATQNFPLTKWSANTSVYNITTMENGDQAFRDVDLINGFLWNNIAADDRVKDKNGNNEKGVVSSDNTDHNYPIVTAKNGVKAFAYNRYDAMQGKYGITADNHVKSLMWSPKWVGDYYANGDDLYSSVVYLSDTPYLYFSTEAPDTQKIAISLLIGTPVQEEKTSSGTQTEVKNTGNYEYRWYTITDNSDRPGIDSETMKNSMVPLVTVSDVVATVYAESKVTDSNGTVYTIKDAFAQQGETIMKAVMDAGKTDPLALAQAKGINTDTMYVDGAITGCIDFTNILPAVMSQFYEKTDTNGNKVKFERGREDIQYKIAKVRVDTKKADSAPNESAFRINYMYFGPSLVTNFTPQSTVGSDVDAQSWQYKQTSSNSVGATDTTVGGSATASDERAYTSGWENGAAISITNTPNTPNLITVDTYGDGKGELIGWDEVPAGADILRGGSDNSKVWKFTDANGKTQYMEAEYNKANGDYYIMVSLPVRKWINVLGESRKISLNATLYQKGGTSKDKIPAFVLWGNEVGALGPGHGGDIYGTRFRHEDLIMVFSTFGQYYHVDQGQPYIAAEVDRTIGDSVIWNAPGETNESWFDMLRSPYTYEQTVTYANADCKTDEDMIGYSYIATMRFAMPIGSKITIQNMKGDGNSAGLNAYSTTGHIVSAYDGGTGEHPNVDVTSTLPEKSVTVTKNVDEPTKPTDYTYTQSNYGDNTLKGNITSGAAAYGPMLQESFYTIYDLLDTELIKSTSDEAHHSSNIGKNKQPVYGQAWKVVGSSDLKIYHAPTTSGSVYGHVYSDSEFIVYATVKFEDEKNSKWGMTGVLTKSGTTEIGWVLLWDGNANKQYASAVSGTLYEEVTTTRAKYDNWNYPRNLVTALKNDWTITNFSTIGANADFRDGTNSSFKYSSVQGKTNSTVDKPFDESQVVYTHAYGGPMLKFANMWNGGMGGTSSGETMSDMYLRAVNGTDLEWGFKRKNNTNQHASVAMTRVLHTPIRLKQGKLHQHASFPVLYLDYTAGNSFHVGLSLRVDGVDDLWYVYGKNYISPSSSSVGTGNNYCYYSFEDMLTKDFKDASTVEVIAISLYGWTDKSETSYNNVIRRCEIWQEEVEWLDRILADNQQAGGDSSTQMNATVKDSTNIINDSFFFKHNESTDGSIDVVKKGSYASGTNIGFNNAEKGYEFTVTDKTKQEAMDYWENSVHYQYNRTQSYRKTNSNKGWKAYIRIDTNKDGKVDANDTTYYSYDNTEVNGVYQYRSALGHLRIWGPADSQTSVVFEADRSFNTDNYRYLYYSYSMRDVDSGISAEEPDTDRDDGLKPGIAVSIKQNQHGSSMAYSEIVTTDGKRTWAFYDSGNPYWSEDGRDNRAFKTTINAAADLSTFDGIDSVNQFVFYLNNPTNKTAEFYINYLYLSNVPPTELIKENLEEEVVQYYYLMDNTGDRYSARFPTLDNPTGQVDGLTDATDRVNPVIVKRGARLSDASYFNGAKLYGYDGYTSGSKYQVSSTDTKTGSMKDIMFYDGYSSDLNDIPDYYTYKDMDNDGTKDIYDMTWSYGRWHLGSGESALNIMYIGEPGKDTGDGTWKADTVSGALTRRYATENYVLLRGGIEPVRYPTYYDANGGEFIYEGSDGDLQNLQKFTENSYYINSTAIQSYFNDPKAYAGMYQGHEVPISGSGTSFTNTKTNETFTATIYGVNYTSSSDTYTVTTGAGNTPYKVAKFFGSDGSQLTYSWTDKNRNGAIEYGEVFDHFYLQKPGYIFSHWEHIDTATGNSDKNFNKDGSGNVTSPDKNGARLLKYTKKGLANLDFFKAVWIVDPAFSGDNSKTYTANFYVNETDAKNNSKPFTTITTDDEGGYSKVNGKFILTMPRITNMVVDGTRILVYGWYRFDEKTQTADKSKIFSPSDKLYLLKNTKFVPATSSTYTSADGETVTLDNLFTMKVMGARLWAVTTQNKEHLVTDHGAQEKAITENGKIVGYEYSDIIANRHYRARPIDGATTGYGWTSVVKQDNPVEREKELFVGSGSTPILSNNPEFFEFYPHENLDINYGQLPSTSKKVFVTSTPSTNKTARTMRVYTRFYATEGATVVAAGTIRAIDPNFTNAVGLKNGKLDTASIASKMQLDPKSVTAATVKSGAFATVNSAFKANKATAWSKFGEYYLSSTHTATTERTYYMRGFVIYQLAGSSAYHVEYSDVVGVTGVDEIVTFDTL